MDTIIRSFLLSLFIFICSFSSIQAQTLPQVIFVNHVRGEECCDVGSLQNLERQLNYFSEKKIPAFFALRYDALTNPKYQQLIRRYATNELFQFGIMLEVTPQLAKDSFVAYKDDAKNWFQAQNVFLIGYNPEDRLALIDTLVDSYQQLFNQSPQFSTAWQVDATSLTYLQDEYGLKMHQIAREQWGLDSYTLDGGPPHYPYLASQNWPFIPDFSDTSNLLIIRHTIDDPLYSYGDNSSAFTSQPNDYVLDGKDFGYFERILDQALDQTHQPGFVNLGLENSMAETHQQEYLKQINKIATFRDQDKVIVVNSIDELKSLYQPEKITIHQGKDIVNGGESTVFWVTTPQYRLRLRFSNTKVLITDLRVYDPRLEDPYLNKSAQNKGYLISPYLINDGIHFPELKEASLAQKLLSIPMINSFNAEPKKDVSTQHNYISLPNLADFSSISIPSKNTIAYESEKGYVSFNFNQDTFEIKSIDKNDITFKQNSFGNNPIVYTSQSRGGEIAWNIDKEKSHAVDWVCENENCLFEFELNPLLFERIIEKQYPFIFPEKKPRQIDKDKTITYVHNRYAIAGRNPVRIVLVPQDAHGFPTSSEQKVIVKTTPEADFIQVENQNSSQIYQFVDITHNQAQKFEVDLHIDDLSLPTQTIYFAPNCKSNLRYCLLHPRQSWWFIRTMIEDKIRLKLLGEKQ